MHLPRHHRLALEITGFPDPASDAVLRAKSLVDQRLIVEGFSQLLFFDAAFNFPLYTFECIVDISQVCFLVK